MAIIIKKDPNDLLIKSQYKTILKAKAIAQELFEEFEESMDEDDSLHIQISSDEDDDLVLVIDEEPIEISESLDQVISSLIFDLSEQEIVDFEASDLELEITSTGSKVRSIGLYERDPEEEYEDIDDD